MSAKPPPLPLTELLAHLPGTVDWREAQRLFHGRGHCYPGLEHICLDWLDPVLLLTLYREVPETELQALITPLSHYAPACRSIQVQYRCRPRAPFSRLWGEAIDAIQIEEAGLRFHIRLQRAQNSGLFLDMRAGRQWVREWAGGKSVLNLFAYTCGFSVAALAGGAHRVVNFDMSRAALTQGRENHRLNGQDTDRVTFQAMDIFRSFSRLRKYGPYELLICDPPTRQQGSVDIARDYAKILRRIPELVRPGGELLLCLNAPQLDAEFLCAQMRQSCPSCQYIQRLPNPASFPEAEAGKGLKVLQFHYPG